MSECGCNNTCPPLTQLDPALPGVSSLLSSGSLAINGVQGGTGSGTPTVSLVNDNNAPGNSQYYGTNSSGVFGYFSIPAGSVASIATSGSLTGGPITDTGTIQLVNDSATPGNTQYYGTNSSGTKGFYSLPSGLISPLTTKGDIYTRNASADTRLGVGSNGQFLQAQSSQATGLQWATINSGTVGFTPAGDITATSVQAAIVQLAGFYSTFSNKGDLLTYTGSAPATLAVGTNGQVLTANSAAANGVQWSTPVTQPVVTTTAVTGNHTLANTDWVVEVSNSAASSIFLNAGASYTPKQVFTIKDAAGNAGANNITIMPFGSETIDNGPSFVININNGDVSFYFNGTKWLTL